MKKLRAISAAVLVSVLLGWSIPSQAETPRTFTVTSGDDVVYISFSTYTPQEGSVITITPGFSKWELWESLWDGVTMNGRIPYYTVRGDCLYYDAASYTPSDWEMENTTAVELEGEETITYTLTDLTAPWCRIILRTEGGRIEWLLDGNVVHSFSDLEFLETTDHPLTALINAQTGGRDAWFEYNPYAYYLYNADLQENIGIDPAGLLTHWETYGQLEKRIYTSYRFDLAGRIRYTQQDK